MNRYRGLLLDFGGVLTTDFYGALRAFCVRECLPADAVEHALTTPIGQRALAGVESGQLTQREWQTTLAKLLGVDDHRLLHRMLADLRPRPEVIDLVARARCTGVATAVLSNSWGTGDYDPYHGYDLAQRFDALVISDQIGLRKPDPAIYLLAARQIGVEPAACVFVDDTERNLPPARQLGMATVLFRNATAGIAEIERLLDLI